MAEPRIIVFSALFPSPAQPNAGLFIRERMFRIGKRFPLCVVSPQPWFPLQGLIRVWRPGYRPPAPAAETQYGVEVHRPRFLAIPGMFRQFDGLFMALGSFLLVRRLKREFDANLLDAHFAYPDGYAAALLGRWCRLPFTVTLRGTEVPLSRSPAKLRRMRLALGRAAGIVAVADSLKRHVALLGVDPAKITVVANGVDTDRFQPVPQDEARRLLGVSAHSKVLITVGGLTERKGFHRVIEVIPALRLRHPDLIYLVVGGASAEGDWETRLKQQVQLLGLEGVVRFLGTIAPDRLRIPLSASNLFVLSTRNEGWANVLLEAMACGLPVVATDVGGNAEIVCRPELGTIVPFDDKEMLFRAIDAALERDWDRGAIRRFAQDNAWEKRVASQVLFLMSLKATG